MMSKKKRYEILDNAKHFSKNNEQALQAMKDMIVIIYGNKDGVVTCQNALMTLNDLQLMIEDIN